MSIKDDLQYEIELRKLKIAALVPSINLCDLEIRQLIKKQDVLKDQDAIDELEIEKLKIEGRKTALNIDRLTLNNEINKLTRQLNSEEERPSSEPVSLSPVWSSQPTPSPLPRVEPAQYVPIKQEEREYIQVEDDEEEDEEPQVLTADEKNLTNSGDDGYHENISSGEEESESGDIVQPQTQTLPPPPQKEKRFVQVEQLSTPQPFSPSGAPSASSTQSGRRFVQIEQLPSDENPFVQVEQPPPQKPAPREKRFVQVEYEGVPEGTSLAGSTTKESASSKLSPLALILSEFGVDAPTSAFTLATPFVAKQEVEGVMINDFFDAYDEPKIVKAILKSLATDVYITTNTTIKNGGRIVDLPVNDQDMWFVDHGDWNFRVVSTVCALKSGENGVVVPIKEFIDIAVNSYDQTAQVKDSAIRVLAERQKAMHDKWVRDGKKLSQKPTKYQYSLLNPLLRQNATVFHSAASLALTIENDESTQKAMEGEITAAQEKLRNEARRNGVSMWDEDAEEGYDSGEKTKKGAKKDVQSLELLNRTKSLTLLEYEEWISSYGIITPLEVFDTLFSDRRGAVLKIIASVGQQHQNSTPDERKAALRKAVKNYLFPEEHMEESPLDSRWGFVTFDLRGVGEYRESQSIDSIEEAQHSVYITRTICELMSNANNVKIVTDDDALNNFTRTIIRSWIYENSSQNPNREPPVYNSIELPAITREEDVNNQIVNADLTLLKYTPNSSSVTYSVPSGIVFSLHKMIYSLSSNGFFKNLTIKVSTSLSIIRGLQWTKTKRVPTGKLNAKGEPINTVELEHLAIPEARKYLQYQRNVDGTKGPPFPPPTKIPITDEEVSNFADFINQFKIGYSEIHRTRRDAIALNILSTGNPKDESEDESEEDSDGEEVEEEDIDIHSDEEESKKKKRRQQKTKTNPPIQDVINAFTPQQKEELDGRILFESFSLYIDRDFDYRVLYALTNVFAIAKRFTFVFSSVKKAQFFAISNWFVRSRFYGKRKTYPDHVAYVNLQMHITDRENPKERLPAILRGRLTITEF